MMILLAIIGIFVWLFFDELHKIRIRNAQAQQAAQMARLAKAQATQAREQARLQREQERQAAQLQRHEEKIAKINFRLSEAERTLAHYEPQLEALRRQAYELDYTIKYFDSKGLPCAGKKKELIKINEQIFKIEGRVSKAQFDKAQAEQRLSA